MPYYKDIQGEFHPSSMGGFNYPHAVALKATTGFRSKPKDENSVLVPDFQADPYAYFLNTTQKREFLAAAEARGMDVTYEPDRGHAFDSYSYELMGTFSGGRLVNQNGATTIGWSEAMLLPYFAGWTDSGPYVGDCTRIPDSPSPDTLPNFAQRAIARTAPKLAEFNISAFLGELREGLPSFVSKIATAKLRSDLIKGVGGDYLNVQFGWVPLLNDLREIASIFINATELMSGRPVEGAPVYRKWGLPETEESWTRSVSDSAQVSPGNGIPGINHPLLSAYQKFHPSESGLVSTSIPGGTGRIFKTLKRRQWFEGSYVTFYPLGYQPPSDYAGRLKVLFDPKITPSVLWQLAPWSWLIDWGLHLGDSIEANQISSEKLALIRYAYAMEKTTMITSMDYSIGSFTWGIGSQQRTYIGPRYHTFTSTTTRKRRIRANPYGFTSGGLEGLKANQIAILAALGLSRL